MSPVVFFGIVFVALAVLCYLDLQRTKRRAANRRTWVRYFAARQHRLDCEQIWEAAWNEMIDTNPWNADLRATEMQASKACIQAQALVDAARAERKGKCPKDLLYEYER